MFLEQKILEKHFQKIFFGKNFFYLWHLKVQLRNRPVPKSCRSFDYSIIKKSKSNYNQLHDCIWK